MIEPKDLRLEDLLPKYWKANCDEKCFTDVVSGEKTFLVIGAKHEFDIGDTLEIRELDDYGKKTGRITVVDITFIENDPELVKKGSQIIGIRK